MAVLLLDALPCLGICLDGGGKVWLRWLLVEVFVGGF